MESHHLSQIWSPEATLVDGLLKIQYLSILNRTSIDFGTYQIKSKIDD